MAAEPDRAQRLAVLFEQAPAFLRRLLAEEWPGSWSKELDRAERIALAMPEPDQVELLGAHPRIGATPGSVSALSYAEQGYEHDPGTAELEARLARLNDEYERRFGFRFVIWVAGRPRAEIADIMESHLERDRDSERERGLRDVIAIARDRAARLGIVEEAVR